MTGRDLSRRVARLERAAEPPLGWPTPEELLAAALAALGRSDELPARLAARSPLAGTPAPPEEDPALTAALVDAFAARTGIRFEPDDWRL